MNREPLLNLTWFAYALVVVWQLVRMASALEAIAAKCSP